MAEQKFQKIRAILALDIEARGPSIKDHGILSIGYCLGRADKFEILESARISMKPLPGQEYDPKCLEEFWSRHEEIKERLEKEAQQSASAMYYFDNLLHSWDATYQVHIVADFSAFDLGFIDQYLVQFGLDPLTSTRGSGKFRPLYDTDSYARGARGMDYSNPWTSDAETASELGFEVGSQSTHYPDEDARHVYETHIKTMLLAANARKRAMEE